MQSALQTLKSDVGVKHNFFDNENVKRERGLLRFLLVGFLMLYVSRVRVEKKYWYSDSEYQSGIENSYYICVVLLYCTTTYTIFSSLNKESSLKGFSEEKLKRSCTTYYYSSVNFFYNSDSRWIVEHCT